MKETRIFPSETAPRKNGMPATQSGAGSTSAMEEMVRRTAAKPEPLAPQEQNPAPNQPDGA